MKNFSFNMINPNTGKLNKYWYSRSVAVTTFAFIKHNNEWYVLANKRGIGCLDWQGYWNCPGGFLDFDETTEYAANREVWEETGLNIPIDKLNLYTVHSTPVTEAQTVTIIYYTILDSNFFDNYKNKFTSEHSEKDEISEIQFIRIKDINSYKWAFNHKKRILEIFSNKININIFQKIYIKLGKLLCNNGTKEKNNN